MVHTQDIRRGITLLEVLISMGLLAVGLLAALSLFPAGGSYLRKADIDNRAAALIPAAYQTMLAEGLFRNDALYWRDDPAGTADDSEPTVYGYPTLLSLPRDVVITHDPRDSADIRGYHPSSDDLPTISGNGPPGTVVTITATGPATLSFTTTADSNTGNFTLVLPPGALPVPNMTIDTTDTTTQSNRVTHGGKPQTGFDDWTFTPSAGASISNISPPANPPRLGGEPAAPQYRQYRLRRTLGSLDGPARFDFMLSTHPASTSTSSADAVNLDGKFSQRGQIIDNGRVRFGRRSTVTVSGELWRYQVGRKNGRSGRYFDFPNAFNGSALDLEQPGTPRLPPNDYWLAQSSSYEWLDSSWQPASPNAPEGIKQDEADWYQFSVRKGELVEVDISDVDPSFIDYSFDIDYSNRKRLFPLYFNGDTDNEVLDPVAIGSNTLTYLMPNDGIVRTQIFLQSIPSADIDANNELVPPPPATPPRPTVPFRINHGDSGGSIPDYKVDISVIGNTRVAAIDPLMTSHIDRIVAANPVHPLGTTERNKYFARFQQTGRTRPDGSPDPTVIPRMTYRHIAEDPVTNVPRAFDESVALAEKLCRSFDSLEVVVPQDETLAPQPIFESLGGVPGGPATIRRTIGKMSWLLTVQPENDGSIELNWTSGSFFDVSIVVFEDRPMPRLADNTLDGEHLFDSAVWNPNTGFIDVTIPSGLGIEADDLRRIFRAGALLMLAPKTFSHNQTIDWIQIQTCEFNPTFTTASILPTREPTVNDPSNQLFVLAYQGVVAVARRSVRIE